MYTDRTQKTKNILSSDHLVFPPAGSRSNLLLQDNRPQSIAKKELANALASKYTNGKTTQLKRYKTGLPGQQLVLQKYESRPNCKLSEHGDLLLRNPYNLYASGPRFTEANRIGGNIEFKKGDEISEGSKDLNKVIPVIKPGSPLEISLGSFNEEEEAREVKPSAMRKLPDLESLKEEFREFVKDHREEAKESPGKAQQIFGGGVDPENREDLRELIRDMAELAHGIIQTIGVPVLERRIDHYLEMQHYLSGKPLMPSDCRAMASYVAGFDAGSEGVVTDQIAAGNVYKHTTENQHAEWPFHYATIIMTDDADHVTMENAAAKASDKFSKMQYDHSWYFEMYGNARGQSFADKYRADFEKRE